MDQHKSSGSSFEQLYLKERKKGQFFMVATGVALALAIGSFSYALNKKPEQVGSTTLGENGPTTRFNGDGPGGGGGLHMQMDVTRFLNDDGSVDAEAVNEMLENVPDDFRENMLDRVETQIDEAQADGDITADQATALKSAFGITGATDES